MGWWQSTNGRAGAGPALRLGNRTGRWHHPLVRLSLVIACLLLAGPPAMAQARRHVLVLYSFGRLLPANLEGDRSLRETFATQPDIPVTISFEYLDNLRFTGPTYEDTFATYLRNKYASMPPEVILVASNEAFDFFMRHRGGLFPGVPIVYMNLTERGLRSLPPMPPDVLGTKVKYDFVGVLEQAVRWHPDARKVVFVTGASSWDRGWDQLIRSRLDDLPPGLTFEFMSGLPAHEVKRRLSQLRPGALVFTPGYFVDGDGVESAPRESTQFIAEHSPVPVYGAYTTQLGMGIVAGRMAGFDEVGQVGAQTALALLRGVAPADVKPADTLPTRLQVDWRQLERWRIPAKDVPAGTRMWFREPTLWESQRELVILSVAVFLLQSGLIAALLLERRRRRRTVAALAGSEKRMRLAADVASLSGWYFDEDGPSWAASNDAGAGLPEDVAGGPFGDFRETLARISPQDRPAVDAALREALETKAEFEVEYRLDGADGDSRWQSARGGAELSSPTRLVGVAIDITQRKRAEAQTELDRAALYHMSRVSLLGQLSASIAHQLNQPLASILANAETAQKMLEREPVDLAELRLICDDIVADDQRADQVIRRLSALFRRGASRLEPIDLNELVRDSLDLIRGALNTRRAMLITELEPGLSLVSGDRVQLQQLLLNLIVNAADAMAEAGDGHEVTISTASDGGMVKLCVADCGPGIPPDAHDKLFEPFWTTRPGGMGMGLAVCRSIAVAHNGNLTARDGTAGGAVFCASFPLLASS